VKKKKSEVGIEAKITQNPYLPLMASRKATITGKDNL